jgi:hypothetical protein
MGQYATRTAYACFYACFMPARHEGERLQLVPRLGLYRLIALRFPSLLPEDHFPTTLADWITTFVCGTSPIGPRVVVGVPSIFFTTSMPATTLPNTA